MTEAVSAETLRLLRALDTPTVSNAIESFGVRPRSLGHTDARVKCMFPGLGAALGCAVTFTTSEWEAGEARDHDARFRLYEAVERAPKPCVLVQQDIGPRPLSACFWGEIMSNLFHRLGAEGVVLDGVVRDLEAMRERGFKVWAGGVTASRADLRVVDVNVPVAVGGLAVLPGDLIHADANGAVAVPKEIAAEVPAAAERVLAREKQTLELIHSDEFSLAELRRRFYS
ncbi:MAG: RraA family protein [bacterium]